MNTVLAQQAVQPPVLQKCLPQIHAQEPFPGGQPLQQMAVMLLKAVDSTFIPQPAQNILPVQSPAADPVQILLRVYGGQCGKQGPAARLFYDLQRPIHIAQKLLWPRNRQILSLRIRGNGRPIKIAVVAAEFYQRIVPRGFLPGGVLFHALHHHGGGSAKTAAIIQRQAMPLGQGVPGVPCAVSSALQHHALQDGIPIQCDVHDVQNPFILFFVLYYMVFKIVSTCNSVQLVFFVTICYSFCRNGGTLLCPCPLPRSFPTCMQP